MPLFTQVPRRVILRSWTSALRSSWKLTHTSSGLRVGFHSSTFTPRTSRFPSAPPCVRRALAYPRLRPSPRLSGWLSHPPCVQRAGADLPQKLSLRLPFARGPHVQPRDPCRSPPEAYPSSSLPLFALLVGILRSPRSHNRLTPWISLKAKTPWMASTPWTEGSLPSFREVGAAGHRPSRSFS